MYTAVKTAAKQMKLTSKDWATLRTELIQALRENDQWYDLVDVHIHN